VCTECGCGQPATIKINGVPGHIHDDGSEHAHDHPHGQDHSHEHSHDHSHEHSHGDVSHSHLHSHSHEHLHAHADAEGRHVHGIDDLHNTCLGSSELAHEHLHSPEGEHGVEELHEASHDFHGHEHGHGSVVAATGGVKTNELVAVHKSILSANQEQADRNRNHFKELGLLSINILSSPGSGKTTLLQKTIELLSSKFRCGVIVGDLETDNDARRLRETGAPVVQISTGTLCHLDAGMVSRAFSEIEPEKLKILFVENVGNLVCPATFDLGEGLRLALLSTTEGEDKPLKYPPMFRFADVVIVSKGDLAEVCEFKRELMLANILQINPKAQIFEVSSKTGEGMSAWCDFLAGCLAD
jgi:hydrogenase nickel incorporation protein HypB